MWGKSLPGWVGLPKSVVSRWLHSAGHNYQRKDPGVSSPGPTGRSDGPGSRRTRQEATKLSAGALGGPGTTAIKISKDGGHTLLIGFFEDSARAKRYGRAGGNALADA